METREMEGLDDFDMLLAPDEAFIDTWCQPQANNNSQKQTSTTNTPVQVLSTSSSSVSVGDTSTKVKKMPASSAFSQPLIKSPSIKSSCSSVEADAEPDDRKNSGEKEKRKRKKISYAGMTQQEITEAKRTRRREQIAKASRLSRARRKQELNELREENTKLKDEREAHLKQISNLQRSVDALRQTGQFDVVKENQLLRAQLDQHKSFLAHFRQLCEQPSSSVSQHLRQTASPTLSAGQQSVEVGLAFEKEQRREAIFQQGANAAHEHVVALMSQSVADGWKEVDVPDHLEVPYGEFSMHYKLATEVGLPVGSHIKSTKQRLNVRMDITYEGMDAAAIGDFLWSSLCSSSAQQRLYNVHNIEIAELEEDSKDTNTKLFYYREKNAPPVKDNDWVVIVNKRSRDLPLNLLQCPGPQLRRRGPLLKSVPAIVLSLSTTQHNSVPEISNANRINSFFIQGASVYNDKANAKLAVVFSFPDDFHTTAISGFDDLIRSDGQLAPKFVEVIKELYSMMDEQAPC